MKKIVSVLSTLAVLFAANLSISTTSAKAGYWTSTPQYGGGTIHRYTPTWNYNSSSGRFEYR